LLNSKGLQIYPHVLRIRKMACSHLDSWLVVQNDIQQCGVEFYVLTTLDWWFAPSHNIPRYLEQNVNDVVILDHSSSEDTAMDKDRIKGSAKQAKGAVKEAAGKVFGDKKLETEGKADKAAGKVQNAVGGLKDAVRGK
jgi:uncharacterized protein YjbJ (UPF0337 family)